MYVCVTVWKTNTTPHYSNSCRLLLVVAVAAAADWLSVLPVVSGSSLLDASRPSLKNSRKDSDGREIAERSNPWRKINDPITVERD